MENAIQLTLARLRDDFITRLPERLRMLEHLLAAVEQGDNGSIAILQREAHSLVGSAGVHRLTASYEGSRQYSAASTTVQVDPPFVLRYSPRW